jgi:hypothetical protein
MYQLFSPIRRQQAIGHLHHLSTNVAMRHEGYIMRLTSIAAGITLLVCISPPIRAQSVHDANHVEAVRAINQEVDRLDPFQLVQSLIQRFGPRLTGSDSEHRSAAWVFDQLSRAGLSHVHTET